MSGHLTDRIKVKARSLGFDLVGVTDVVSSEQVECLRTWLDRGFHGEMAYLARSDGLARRKDLTLTLEGVRSVVVVGQNYFHEDPDGVPSDPGRAVVARYARGLDYHDVIKNGLGTLHGWLEEELGRPVGGRVYVDTGPILEREMAQRAGLGWFGRNTMLIHPRLGSYFFLGVLLLRLALEGDERFVEDRCGSCSRCLVACPTEALLGRDERGAPVIDARRCISYLTIELRGWIPRELRRGLGNRVFGCDICQEVCPWNEKFARPATEEAYQSHRGLDGPSLVVLAESLLKLTEGEFGSRYRGLPIRRAKRRGLLRNVCVALGNWAKSPAIPPLRKALEDADPLVRGHAAWALSRLMGQSPDSDSRIDVQEIRMALGERYASEKDPAAREELRMALDGSPFAGP
jgi:epoxyqueuosine reductase